MHAEKGPAHSSVLRWKENQEEGTYCMLMSRYREPTGEQIEQSAVPVWLLPDNSDLSPGDLHPVPSTLGEGQRGLPDEGVFTQACLALVPKGCWGVPHSHLAKCGHSLCSYRRSKDPRLPTESLLMTR